MHTGNHHYGPTEQLDSLVGRTIRGIYMGEETIVFVTDAEPVAFTVYGDCCSHSYFYDFYGVSHLLDNGPIIAWEAVALDPGDPGYVTEDNKDNRAGDYGADQVVCYGYRFTTVHPMFGEVSSVFSFRNDSNGYYGGDLADCETPDDLGTLKLLTKDEVG